MGMCPPPPEGVEGGRRLSEDDEEDPSTVAEDGAEVDAPEDDADDVQVEEPVFRAGIAVAAVPLAAAVLCAEAGRSRSHGWRRMSSRLRRASGGTWRQPRMRSWHSWERRTRKRSSARQICSSVSKGMSPQTMSKRRMPRDQTVASSPL